MGGGGMAAGARIAAEEAAIKAYEELMAAKTKEVNELTAQLQAAILQSLQNVEGARGGGGARARARTMDSSR